MKTNEIDNLLYTTYDEQESYRDQKVKGGYVRFAENTDIQPSPVITYNIKDLDKKN